MEVSILNLDMYGGIYLKFWRHRNALKLRFILFYLIRFGIILRIFWLRHCDEIQYLRSICGCESKIISFMAISIAIAKTDT